MAWPGYNEPCAHGSGDMIVPRHSALQRVAAAIGRQFAVLEAPWSDKSVDWGVLW